MKSLKCLLSSRKKDKYQKLKTRFIKNLKAGQADRDSTTFHWIERLKKLERQLGIRSSLKLRHWALAAAIGIITTAASMKAKVRDAYSYDNAYSFRKNEFTEFVEARKEMAMMVAPGDTSFIPGPFLGDSVITGTGRKVADFDGDGDLDFISFNYYKDHTLYLNNGSGIFDSKIPIAQAAGVEFSKSDTVDFDGDGDVDLLVLENYYPGTGSRIQFFENDGSGAFNGDSTIFVDNSNPLKKLQSGDVDNDGDVDIITATWYGTNEYRYRFLINEGVGNAWSSQYLFFGQYSGEYTYNNNQNYDDVIRLADFDGDGELDVLAMPNYDTEVNYYNSGNTYEGFRVFFNDGIGGFDRTNAIISEFLNYYRGDFNHDLIIRDIDNDGDLDVVFSTRDNYPQPEKIAVAINDGFGNFTIPQAKNFGPYDNVYGFSVGNFDGDADLEIVVEYRATNAQLTEIFDFDNVADTFSISITTLDATLDSFYDITVGDFDNDGDDDVIGFNYFDLEQFQNNSGTFDKINQGYVEPVWANEFLLVDIDGDGDLDIAGNILGQFLTNDGSGNFTLVQTLADSVGTVFEEFAIGDFDNDGDQDLVFSEDVRIGSNVYRYLRPFAFAGGQFSSLPKVALDTGTNYLDNLQFIELGNLDGDPELELVTRKLDGCCNKYISVHDFVAGNFDSVPLTIINPSGYPKSLKIIDFDNNGVNDLVIEPDYGDIDIYENANNDGTQFIQTAIINRYGSSLQNLDTADLDADGDLDLLLTYGNPSYSIYTGHRIIYNGSDTTAFSSASLGLTFPNYQAVYAGRFMDIDADGDKDIVFANYYNGDNVLLNTGGQVFEERPFLSGFNSFNLAIGDVDGDGDEDILSSQYESGLSQILFNEIIVAPDIQDQLFAIDEGVANGTVIDTVQASSAFPLTFSILSGNGSGAFAIDAALGEISVADSTQIDFETTPTYALVIEAFDGSLGSTATVTIDINDIDEAPSLSDSTFSVNENLAAGTLINTLVATDPEGLGVSYNIVSGNGSGAFAINTTNGDITVADSTQFDFETTTQFILGVEATDGTNPDPATLTINIVDVDEAPILSDSTFSINENLATGTVINTLLATDPEGLGVTYSITSGNASSAFAINTTSGDISIADSTQFDFETITQFVLGVEATDGTNPTAAQVTVDILDVDEAPIMADSVFNVNENEPPGTVVGTLAATDPEGLGVTYSITSGNATGAFSINTSTGDITIADSIQFNFEVTTQFILGVEATDGTNPTAAQATVDILDVDEIPIVTDQTFVILENPAPGEVISTIPATDPEGLGLNFSITLGNASGAFALNATSGELTVADSAQFDFETTTQFILGVEVTDGVNPVPITVTVDVLDELETTIPTVQDSTFSVPENSINGTVVGTVNATDPLALPLTLSIAASDLPGAFAINASDEVVIADETLLDFESVTTVILTIDAFNGVDTGSGTITIDLTNVNETPVVADALFRVDQDAANGTVFGTLTSSDPEGDLLTYSIVSGNLLNAFAVNATGGLEVADNTAIDFAVTPNYQLEVEASDGTLVDTAQVEVRITTLARDQEVLLELQDSTTVNGPWTTPWPADPLTDGRVNIDQDQQRVVGLDLSNNDLSGVVPQSFLDLTGLQDINLSGNELTGFPDVSEFDSLTTLNLSDNKLGIQDLLDNADGAYTFSFDPQTYGTAEEDTVSAGANTTLVFSELIGYNATYEWTFVPYPFENADSTLVGASESYTIVNPDYAQMGRYYLGVSDIEGLEVLDPGFTLTTEPQTIFARTDVFGTIYLPDEATPMDAGQVNIYRTNSIPFELTDSASIQPDGVYEIDNVVLGDFILLVQNNVVEFPEILQTYYISTNDWVEADTLFLRQEATGIDIFVQERPVPPVDPNGGQLLGLVETDFQEDEGSRIEARRKVKKAGCSLRRRTRSGGGRGQQEEDEYTLFAYVESDDNGEFSFTEIPPGDYLINIQYPGVPMDTTSQIKFTISEDLEGQVFQLSATITEEGISVDLEEILGIEKPYIKEVKLYPNPTKGKLLVDYLVYRRIDDLKLAVVDLQGLMITETKIDHQLGTHQAEVDLTGLESGVYFLVLKDESETFQYVIKIGKH